MPRVHGRERAQLVPDVLRTRAAEIMTEGHRELIHELDVVACLPRWIDGLADALHAGARST